MGKFHLIYSSERFNFNRVKRLTGTQHFFLTINKKYDIMKLQGSKKNKTRMFNSL